jgi:uncharacterized protein (DUF58 family)
MRVASAFPGFRLKLTRWGGLYILAVLVLGFAAVNTGNNALMATLGLALASYGVSGLWSRQVLGSLEVAVDNPNDVFAERPVVVGVHLANRSRIFPAYGVVVRDAGGRVLLCEPKLLPRASVGRAVEVRFPNRGWVDFGPWTVEILLPLGFFVKSKSVLQGRRLLVYPRLLRHAGASPRRGAEGREAERFDHRGREGEVVQLRGYRDGDDPRQLHWKQTARQQRPIVVDRQRRAAAPAIFVIDPFLEDPGDPVQRTRFEERVSEVATGVVRTLESGSEVGLVVGRDVIQPIRGRRRAAILLRPLAEVQPLPQSGRISVAGTPAGNRQ